MPTIAQAQNLAKICKRSFAILYMSEPPKKFQLISDYRRLTAQNTNSISFTLSELINTTSIKQEWIHTYLSDDGAKELDYVGIYKISTPLADIMK